MPIGITGDVHSWDRDRPQGSRGRPGEGRDVAEGVSSMQISRQREQQCNEKGEDEFHWILSWLADATDWITV